MELYQHMTTNHMSPTPHAYALLMRLCLQRDMPEACQRLFKDLQRRGNRPSSENYALMIESLAAEVPPKWEQAIELFDKMSRSKHTTINADTYNALMRVYLNMRPFDWRVVYNCYYEMRRRKPRIPLQWSSYLLLSEAMRRGRAGKVRRMIAYVDAWMAATPLFSRDFWVGCAVYTTFFMLLKAVGTYVGVKVVEGAAWTGSASESKLG
ncbi:hypothetical protein STCU_07895 [Strigomonas culicis]|nr:hypothetical protein STCU_07895 [Strigomonas culicis]|eukprot:EPY23063.1 hypothetical protein STCU_07895 [Strigomonas culicis]